MKTMAKHIAQELAKAKHCAVYEPELSRIWPDRLGREVEIAKFAQQHGWRLGYYKDGFCAIFDKRRTEEFIRDQTASMSAA